MDELDDLFAGVEERLAAERGVVGSLRALSTRVRVVFAALSVAAAVGLSTLVSPAGVRLRGHLVRLGCAAAMCLLALANVLPGVEAGGAHRGRRRWTAVVSGLAPLLGFVVVVDASTLHGPLIGFGCVVRGLVVAAPMALVISVLARRRDGDPTRGAFVGIFAGSVASMAVELACRHHDELHALVYHVPMVGLLGALGALGSSARVTFWPRSR